MQLSMTHPPSPCLASAMKCLVKSENGIIRDTVGFWKNNTKRFAPKMRPDL